MSQKFRDKFVKLFELKPRRKKKMISQFATKLGGFSSQYGTSNTVTYVVPNILNGLTNYPNYGDFTEAAVLRTYDGWWKMAPEASPPLLNQSERYFISDDFIELIYDQKVYITEVNIFETYNPGAVVRILALDQSVEASSTKKWVVMWEMDGGRPAKAEQESRVFSPRLRSPPFPSQVIRLEMNHAGLAYHTEYDAVELVGDTDIDVDQLGKDITGQLKDMSLGEKGDFARRVSDSPDNGYFDLLPNEVISTILKYLALEELASLTCVSSLFREICYSYSLPQHQHLNLQPYWFLLNGNTLQGFSKKCQRVQSINLSWCGTHSDMLSSPSLMQLLSAETLTRLDLACCPLSDQCFTKIAKQCVNLKHLDVSSTLEYLNFGALQTISFLTELTWLKLYLTNVDDDGVIAIARGCSQLQYLNLGSCRYISNYDEVVANVTKSCPDIKGLDLWRAESLTNSGISHMSDNLRHLTSLDIGWCPRVNSSHSANNTLGTLIEGSPLLRKLFLAANRHITDNELKLLAKHCPHLEQLDLLGSSSVTYSGILLVMSNCEQMKYLDVSFCDGIGDESHQKLVAAFPKCAIRKSHT